MLFLRTTVGPTTIAVMALNDKKMPCGGIDAELDPYTGDFWVARCVLKAPYRGSGSGLRMMEAFCQALDGRQASANLVPSPYDDTIDLDRLIAFYQRHGFVYRPGHQDWHRLPVEHEGKAAKHMGYVTPARQTLNNELPGSARVCAALSSDSA